jgi:hypothetical protein
MASYNLSDALANIQRSNAARAASQPTQLRDPGVLYKRTVLAPYEARQQSLLNRAQFALGNLVGGATNAIGWVSDNLANPVVGAERAANYLGKYGKSMVQTAINTNPFTGIFGEYGPIETKKRLDELNKAKIEKGITEAKSMQKGQVSGLLKSGAEDVSNVVDFAALVSGVGSLQGAGKMVAGEIGKSGVKGLVNTVAPKAPGFLINKLANLSPGAANIALKTTQGIGSALTRNTIARAAGAVGTGAIKAGIGATIASTIRGGDSFQQIDKHIIPDGPTRTAVELIWGGATDIPYIAGGLQKANTAWSAAKVNAHRKSVYDEVIKVMGDTPEAKKALTIVHTTADGKKVRISDIITEMMVRESTAKGVDIGNMSPTAVKRFRDQFIKQGKWTADNLYNIKHSELFARTGAVKNSLSTTGLDAELAAAKSGTQFGTTGTKQLALPKPGYTGKEIKIGSKVKGVQQSGTLFDVNDVTKPKKKLNFVEEMIYEATQTKTGRKFSTKVDTSDLKAQTQDNIKSYLSDKLGKKSERVYTNLEKAVQAEKSKFIGSADISFLSNKTVKEVLRKSGVLETKSNEIVKTIQKAVNDTLKQNDIFSLKQKISTFAPVVKQADKLYMAGRFKMRPGFKVMQQAETGVGAGLFKGDMQTDVGKEVFGKIMAHKTWGKAGGKIAGPVDASQGIEKIATTGVQESAKSAMARAAYFSDNFIAEVGKTPYAKIEMKKLGIKNIEDLPGVAEYIRGVKKADDPVDFINKWIAGSKPKWEGGHIIESGSKLEMTIKAATEAASKKAIQIGEKIPLYKGLRSPWERQLHTIMFPYSYSKKFLGGGAKFLTTGKAIRPQLTYKMVKGYSEFRDNLEVQSDSNPRLKPVIYLMDVLNPVSTEYPLGFGGTTPFYKAIDTLVTKSKYESGPRLVNSVLKQLSPAVKEYEKLIGFSYNLAGKEEPKKLWGFMDTRSIYPQYREENKNRLKGKIPAFQEYSE